MEKTLSGIAQTYLFSIHYFLLFNFTNGVVTTFIYVCLNVEIHVNLLVNYLNKHIPSEIIHTDIKI